MTFIDKRTENPYLNDHRLRERLRQEQPGRQVWVGDGPERPVGEVPMAYDVFTALLVIGYESFYDHPILPSTVMQQAAEDIRCYALGRGAKDSEDAAEYLHSRSLRPHAGWFLEQVVELVEDAHSAGMHINDLLDAIDHEIPDMAGVAITVNNQTGSDNKFPGQLCTAVWQELLASRV